MKRRDKMLEDVLRIRKLIGDTPMVKLRNKFGVNLFAKLESRNFSGSIKDRAANNIIYNAILDGQVNPDTTIVESSSGNFGISLSMQANYLGLKAKVVVDPHINMTNYKKLKLFANEIIKVTEPDNTGGYLMNRIKKVKEIVATEPNHFWTNQYGNENNYKSYRALAFEVASKLNRLDYLFVAVSSCGTVTGLSKYLKEVFPHLTVVAIDITGSMIFSDVKAKRHIPGLGAGKAADFLEKDTVDDVIILNHEEIINGCRELLNDHSVFVGGSSGACYYGAMKYLQSKTGLKGCNAMMICPDSGGSYMDTIYNDEWVKMIVEREQAQEREREMELPIRQLRSLAS